MISVKFKANWQSYFPGDVAGFPEAFAAALVKGKVADYANPADGTRKANREVITAVLREPEAAQAEPEETPWKDLMSRAKEVADAKGLKLPQSRKTEDLKAFLEEHDK